MNPRVERSINQIASQARLRYAEMLGSARLQTAQVAGRIKNGKKPVKTLSRLGLKLTDVSHRTTSKVVKQQATLLENQLDALASGLKEASKAQTLRELIRGQARLIPANTARLINDGRQTLSIVAAAGGEVRELFANTVSEIRGKSTPRKKKRSSTTKATKKTVATARQSASKAKPAGKKPAAKKTRARTAKKAA